MNRLPRATRAGFTLMELLVVIAIIGVLVALLLPAVQKVREAAARVECVNNLKQIGLAAHSYHGVHKAFPAGQTFSKTSRTYNYMSWMARLLPYIEQEPLWKTTLAAYQKLPIPRVSPPHRGYDTPIAVYTCPSDGRVSQPQPYLGNGALLVALTSYVGVMGRDLETLNGVLYRNSNIRIGDISDGTSNTLFAGERPPSPDNKWGRWYFDYGQDFAGSAGNIMGVRERNLQPVTAGSCAPGYYDFAPGRLDDPCDFLHFWSPHSGGANFVFADGSMRFLRYDVAPLMPALASRAGGEAVQEP